MTDKTILIIEELKYKCTMKFWERVIKVRIKLETEMSKSY